MHDTSILTSGNTSLSVRISYVYLTINNCGDRYRKGIKPLDNMAAVSQVYREILNMI